jgi:CheY-like chemotaxis protein
LKQTPTDILLLDIGMPVLDGFAVVRTLRENPRFAAGCGAYRLPHAGRSRQVMTSGFDGYLSKPVSSQLLVQELDRLSPGKTAPNDYRDDTRRVPISFGSPTTDFVHPRS